MPKQLCRKRSFMQSKVNRRRTLVVMLPLVCAIAALLAFAHRSARQGFSAVLGPGGSSRMGVKGAAKSPVALRGEEAITQLKQEGTYDSLAGGLATATYSINRVNRINRAPLPDIDGSYEAVNPAQSLRTVFTNDGVRVHSSGAWKWQMGLRLTGYGYGKQLRHVASGEIKVQENRVEISKHTARRRQSSSLTEWYVNKPDGLEQGFTLSAPPVMSSQRDADR